MAAWIQSLGVILRSAGRYPAAGALMPACMALLLHMVAAPAAADGFLGERLEISGFARLVGGAINDEGVAFEGYEDSISLDEQSLFALQADLRITDSLKLAGQALAHTADARDSGVEWLYLNFEPSVNWRFKLGRMRTPFVNYSDVIDVGFAYPWISAPAPVYGSYLFTNYEGASVVYQTTFRDLAVEVEAYWGEDETEVDPAGFVVPVEIQDLRGLVAQFRRGNFRARASYHKAGALDVVFSDLDNFVDLLRDSGFEASADSLVARGSADALHLGLRYDTLTYFAEAEWLRIESDVVVSPPQIESVYATLGRNFSPFQAHITVGRSRAKDPQPVDEIPTGVDPFLDALAAGYQVIFDSIPVDNLNYLSTGLRWDFRSTMALKGELTWAEEESPSGFFEVGENVDFDSRTLLFQLGLEWVF